MSVYICKICDMQGKRVEFYKREDLREHIKSVHPDHVERIISRLNPQKIQNLRKRGIDPKNWAAGYIIGILGCQDN